MLELKETIVVEGKYDLMKLKEFIASPIITTEGFRIFADKEKQFLILTFQVLSKETENIILHIK